MNAGLGVRNVEAGSTVLRSRGDLSASAMVLRRLCDVDLSPSAWADMYPPARSHPRYDQPANLTLSTTGLVTGAASLGMPVLGITGTSANLVAYIGLDEVLPGGIRTCHYVDAEMGAMIAGASESGGLKGSVAMAPVVPHHGSGALTLESCLIDTTSAVTVFTYASVVQAGSAGVCVYPLSGGTLLASVPAAPEHPGLARAILAERSALRLDEAKDKVVDAATSDSLKIVRNADLPGHPRVMFSDDGILTLQWQRGEYGVALIFAGDGIASIAFKRPDQFYAENGVDVPVSEELPDEFWKGMAAVLA